MGSSNSKVDRKLRIGCLNYSGIMLSPFEFYSDNSDLKQIGDNFKVRVLKEFCDGDENKLKKFKWSFTAIDKKFKRTRYCPLYNPEVGTKDDVKGKSTFISKK